MIELQVINRILCTKKMDWVLQHDLAVTDFRMYQAEMTFIVSHFRTYGSIPDVETFLSAFPDHEYFVVQESEQYLVETFAEQRAYQYLTRIFTEIGQKVQDSSFRAIEYLQQNMNALKRVSSPFKPGKDLIGSALERLESYQQRAEKKGLLGIATGIPLLDEWLHGWLEEDLVVLMARTNEGKSWILLYFLAQAWLQGKKVLLYSGEMSQDIMGFRLDTFLGHFSNLALMQGEETLGRDHTPETYAAFLHELREGGTPFVVVTPADLGGSLLTAAKLDALITMYQPDIVGVDQLSLVEDGRTKKGDQRYLSLANITRDLYLLSELYKIPILAAAQTKRKDPKKAAEEASSEAPLLEEAYESDGIVQNATRVISIRKTGQILRLAVRKNRYGLRDQTLSLSWDVDQGILIPYREEHVTSSGDSVKRNLGGVDLF